MYGVEIKIDGSWAQAVRPNGSDMIVDTEEEAELLALLLSTHDAVQEARVVVAADTARRRTGPPLPGSPHS